MNSKFARFTMSMRVRMHRKATEEDREKDPTLTQWTNVHDGYLSGDIVVEVDLEGLAKELGEKALRSAGKKAREAGGLVLVRATNVIRTTKE